MLRSSRFGMYVTGIAATGLLLSATAPLGAAHAAETPGCDGIAYVVEFTGSVSTIDTATNQVFGERIQIGNTPGSVVLNPEQTILWVTNNGGGISVIDLATRSVIETVPDDNIPTNIAMSPDGSTVYVANSGYAASDEYAGSVTVISTVDYSATTTPLPIGGAYGIQVAADGESLFISAFSGNDTNVYRVDTATMAITATIDTGSKNKGLSLSPDGATLWVTGHSTNQIHIIDTTTNTLQQSIDVGNLPERVTFAPGGRKAWVTNIGAGTISIVDVRTLKVRRTIKAGPLPFGAAFTPDGKTVYVTNSIAGLRAPTPEGSVTVIDALRGDITETVYGFRLPDNLVVCG